MNKIARTTLLLLLIGVPVWADGPVRIDGAEFDFGQVVSNSTVVHRVWIHAPGPDTLRLIELKTGCGCVTAPLASGTVPPGDSLSIVLYWQTRGSAGAQKLPIYLYLDSVDFPRTIVLSGNVVTPNDLEASVVWRPSVLRPAGTDSKRLTVSFELTNRTDEALAVKVIEAGAGLTIELPESIEARKAAGGRITLENAGDTAEYEGSVTLELSGNQNGGLRVTLPVQYGDFSFRPFFTTKQK